jgi:hypothetical protein
MSITEKDYIDVSNLANIRALQSILRNMCPDEIIQKEEYQSIGKILYIWEKRISIKIE